MDNDDSKMLFRKDQPEAVQVADLLAASESERLEQARLLGMSAERELSLRAKLAEAERAVVRADSSSKANYEYAEKACKERDKFEVLLHKQEQFHVDEMQKVYDKVSALQAKLDCALKENELLQKRDVLAELYVNMCKSIKPMEREIADLKSRLTPVTDTDTSQETVPVMLSPPMRFDLAVGPDVTVYLCSACRMPFKDKNYAINHHCAPGYALGEAVINALREAYEQGQKDGCHPDLHEALKASGAAEVILKLSPNAIERKKKK